MPTTTITPQRQSEILTTVRAISTLLPHERHMAMLGVWVALGAETPPHWAVLIQCGRTEELFSEPTARKNYDVLGLKERK